MNSINIIIYAWVTIGLLMYLAVIIKTKHNDEKTFVYKVNTSKENLSSIFYENKKAGHLPNGALFLDKKTFAYNFKSYDDNFIVYSFGEKVTGSIKNSNDSSIITCKVKNVFFHPLLYMWECRYFSIPLTISLLVLFLGVDLFIGGSISNASIYTALFIGNIFFVSSILRFIGVAPILFIIVPMNLIFHTDTLAKEQSHGTERGVRNLLSNHGFTLERTNEEIK